LQLVCNLAPECSLRGTSHRQALAAREQRDGHDNIDVTAHYAQVSALMMETYNAAHPHAKQH